MAVACGGGEKMGRLEKKQEGDPWRRASRSLVRELGLSVSLSAVLYFGGIKTLIFGNSCKEFGSVVQGESG